MSETEIRQFFHLSQGSELFPVDWLLALRTASGEVFFDPQHPGYGLLADTPDSELNVEGLPIGMTSSPVMNPELPEIPMFGFNCAACHVGELRAEGKVHRVIGAPSAFDINSFLGAFAKTLGETIQDPQRAAQFIDRLQSAKSPTLSKTTDQSTQASAAADANARFLGNFSKPLQVFVAQRLAPGPKIDVTFAGPGRVDAFGAAHNLLFSKDKPWDLTAPVDYPRLWNITKMERYHWDGNSTSIIERNAGEALGLGATFNPETFDSSVRLGNIVQLELLAQKIDPPTWPFAKSDGAQVAEGSKLFGVHCARCHAAEGGTYDSRIGTDGNRINSFAQPMDDGEPFYHRLERTLRDVIARACETQPRLTTDPWDVCHAECKSWKSPRQYQARTLSGIWATAPYLHNGSVPSLAALLELTPRPAQFAVGDPRLDLVNVGHCSAGDDGRGVSRDASQPGNGNGGHPYGRSLRPNDKRALIAYLKTL